MARFEDRDDVLNGPFDIVQIGLVLRARLMPTSRFADCGWRKAYPKLDKFNQKMLERPSVKASRCRRRHKGGSYEPRPSKPATSPFTASIEQERRSAGNAG